MSLLTDFALPSPDSSYLNERHPAAEEMRGSGSNPKRRQIRLWGRSINDGSAMGDIWEAKVNASTAPIVRALPATNKTIQIISDNVADAAAGTGARTVRVYYLDQAGAEHYADYTLNGNTAVVNADKKDGVVTGAAIVDCWRVQYLAVLTAGSGGVNAGGISVNDSTQAYTTGIPNTATLVYGFMAAGFNISHHGMYTVPKGYRAQIKQKLFGVIDATATVKYGKFQIGVGNTATGLMETVMAAGDSSNSGGTTFPMAFETILDEMSDIRFQGLGLSAATSELIAIIDLIVYPKV
jgi:hypothetical protein